jgi:hyperosmotically inducible protein
MESSSRSRQLVGYLLRLKAERRWLRFSYNVLVRNSLEVKQMKKTLIVVLGVSMLFSMAAFASPASQDNPPSGAANQKSIDRIYKEVRHELVTLPFYGVFDNLSYKVDPDGTVTLYGQVTRPTLKSDSENVVKRIEGVTRVVNNIEVLPTSINDDQIRRAVYRAIFGNEVLSQYQMRAVPPIHIIVKNGHVTLEGVVARQMDKQIAGVQANSVSGVFSVTNSLVVEEDLNKGDKKK